MRVLGISGSPRQDGNSEILLGHALAPFAERGWDVVRFHISQNSILPCKGCDHCESTAKCVIGDDMAGLYEEFALCDAMIIASPAYYRNVTAQLKAVFDRSHAVRDSKPLQGKPGGAIAVGRGQDGGQSITLAVIYNFILSSGMMCVPGELNGVTASAYKPGDILTQPNRLKQARVLGENVMKYAETLTAACVQSRHLPGLKGV